MKFFDLEYYKVEQVDLEDVYWHERTGTWLNYAVVNKSNGRIEEFFADYRDATRCCNTLDDFMKDAQAHLSAKESGIEIVSSNALPKGVQ